MIIDIDLNRFDDFEFGLLRPTRGSSIIHSKDTRSKPQSQPQAGKVTFLLPSRSSNVAMRWLCQPGCHLCITIGTSRLVWFLFDTGQTWKVCQFKDGPKDGQIEWSSEAKTEQIRFNSMGQIRLWRSHGSIWLVDKIRWDAMAWGRMRAD